jgi:hypothetical protein
MKEIKTAAVWVVTLVVSLILIVTAWWLVRGSFAGKVTVVFRASNLSSRPAPVTLRRLSEEIWAQEDHDITRQMIKLPGRAPVTLRRLTEEIFARADHEAGRGR